MPHEPPPDWDDIEREEWRKSRDRVAGEVDAGAERVLRVAGTFAGKFGYALKSVLDKIRNDTMFAAHFAKQPGRTGLHERIAAEWISALPEVTDFKTLPKSGPQSVKIDSDGNLRRGAGKKIPGKTLDFEWVSGGKTCYAMHKYTKDSGGAQDNQFNEMKELMLRFLRCSDTGIGLMVIADGEYYQRNNCAKLHELAALERTHPPRSKALAIGDLPAFLRQN